MRCPQAIISGSWEDLGSSQGCWVVLGALARSCDCQGVLGDQGGTGNSQGLLGSHGSSWGLPRPVALQFEIGVWGPHPQTNPCALLDFICRLILYDGWIFQTMFANIFFFVEVLVWVYAGVGRSIPVQIQLITIEHNEIHRNSMKYIGIL